MGPWLPEPVAGERPSPDRDELASDFSMAFLVPLPSSLTRAATTIPMVTTATPASAAPLGRSESSGTAASVVTQGTAAANSAVAVGPSAATARV